MDAAILEKVNEWLQGNYDDATKAAIKKLQAENENDLVEFFCKLKLCLVIDKTIVYRKTKASLLHFSNKIIIKLTNDYLDKINNISDRTLYQSAKDEVISVSANIKNII